MPLFPPLCAGDVSGIVSLALFELGLNEAFFLAAFVRAGGRPRFRCLTRDWAIEEVDVFEWKWICDVLHLPLDSISYGYWRREHRFRVGEAVSEGTYILPMTDSTRGLVREYYRDRKREIRNEAKHYGECLRARMREERYKEMIARRARRRNNRNLHLRKLSPIQDELTASQLGLYAAWTSVSPDSKRPPGAT
jgi:hypothetical protein